jgi:hypothetical protein
MLTMNHNLPITLCLLSIGTSKCQNTLGRGILVIVVPRPLDQRQNRFYAKKIVTNWMSFLYPEI